MVGTLTLIASISSISSAKEMITIVWGAEMSSQKDIVSNVVNAPNLTTLVAAVKAAWLVATLQSDGPFTVFGPDNKAFAKIDAKTIEFLLKVENKDALVKILTYHVVKGNYSIAKLKNNQVLTTVQWWKLVVKKTFKKIRGKYYSIVKIRDEQGNGATITTRNVYQKNGIAHVIDRVLMPSSDMKKDDMMKKEKVTTVMVGGNEMFSNKDIVSNVVNAPSLKVIILCYRKC